MLSQSDIVNIYIICIDVFREGYHMTYYWFFLYQWPGMPHTLDMGH